MRNGVPPARRSTHLIMPYSTTIALTGFIGMYPLENPNSKHSRRHGTEHLPVRLRRGYSKRSRRRNPIRCFEHCVKPIPRAVNITRRLQSISHSTPGKALLNTLTDQRGVRKPSSYSQKTGLIHDGGKQLIPVDFEAYQELTAKNLPAVHPSKLPTQDIGNKVIVPHAPPKALSAGIPLDGLTPVWQAGATPIELLRLLIASVSSVKNVPIHHDRGVIYFSLPPQAPVGLLPHITLLSATTRIEDTERAFQGQAVSFSEHAGKPVQWADGVQVYQFQDARLTSASVFEFPKGPDGKRLLQEKPTGLTTTAEERLRKLNNWAADVEDITAFSLTRNLPIPSSRQSAILTL